MFRRRSSIRISQLGTETTSFPITFNNDSYFSSGRDEVLTKNKFLEEEAKRKAEAVDNSEETHAVSSEDSQLEDDIFYDSQAEEREK